MHTKTRATWLVLLLTIVSMPFAFSQDSPDNPEARAAWMTGYQKFEAAQKAENYKQYQEAHELYQEALETYQEVRTSYPNWNPFILDYRIKFCRKKMAELATKTRIVKKELDTDDVVKLNAGLQERLQVAESKSQELENQIVRLSQALEKARQEAARGAASSDLAENLTWENTKLKKEVESLKRRQAELEAELKLNPKNEQAVAELRRQLEETRQQEETYRQARAQLMREREELVNANKELSVERAQLLVRLKDLEAAGSQEEEKLAQQERRLTALRQENERLAGQLQEQRTTTATQANTIAELRSTLREFEAKDQNVKQMSDLYLKAQTENAQLREELAQASNQSKQHQRSWEAMKENLDKLQVANQGLRNDLAQAERDRQRLTADLKQGNNQAEQLIALRQERDDALAKFEAQKELNRALSMGQKPEEAEPAVMAELNTARDTLQQQKTLINQLTTQLQEAQQAAEEQQLLRRQLASAAEEATAMVQQRTQLEQQLKQSRDELAATTQKLTDVTRQKEALAAAEEQPSQQLITMRKQLASVTEERQALQQQLTMLKQQVTDLQASRTPPADVAKLKTSLETAKTTLAQRDRAMDQLADQMTELRKLTEAQQALLNERETRQTELTAERDRLQAAYEMAQQEAKVEIDMLNRQLQKALEQRELDQELKQQASRIDSPTAPSDQAAVTAEEAEEIDRQLREALAAERQDNTEAAIWLYSEVLAKDPNQHHALVRLGNIHADAGNYTDAEQLLMQAFYQNPDDRDVLLPLGFILVRSEKADLAISMLSRAVALYPEEAAFHRYLGVACRSLGWTDAAQVQLNRSFELDDSSSDTAFNLAILYATMEPPQMEQAKKWYVKAKELGAEIDPGLERLFTESP